MALFYAKAHSRFEYGSDVAQGRLRGFIEVANLAYDKQVTVHYTTRQTGEWREVSAFYLRSLEDGKEVWEFETPEVGYSARLSADFQFAIRFDVSGETHWDNNGGADYRISTGARPIYTSDIILGKSALALRSAAGTNFFDGNTLQGQLLLKNLAYDKIVRIVYTTDGWNTVKEGWASYARPTGDDAELWHFSIHLGGGYGQVMPVELAIHYQVNGMDIWDNNFGFNYSLSAPGSVE